MNKNFAMVIRILVVVLVSVYFYECCDRHFFAQFENISEPQLSSQSPTIIQPSNDSLTTDSPTSVPPKDNRTTGDPIAAPPNYGPSTDSPLSVPPNDNLTTGSPISVPSNDSLATVSQISVEYVAQENSSQPAVDIKLGIYGNDPSKSQPQALQAIDWSAYGSLAPGQSVNSSKAYLRNEGEVPITLSLFAADWSFKDSAGNSLSQSYQQYFTLTWNYDNSLIDVNEVRAVLFTLTISPRIVDVATFSFRLVVTGTY